VIERHRQQGVRGASRQAAATETLVGLWLLSRIIPTVTVVLSDASDEEPSPALAPRFSQSAARQGEELAGQPSRSSYLRQTVSSGTSSWVRPGGVVRPRRSGSPRSRHRRWSRFPPSPGRRSQPSSSRTTIWRKPVVQPLWQACRKSRTPPLRPAHRPSRCGRHCRCRAPGSRPRPGRRSVGFRSEVVRGLGEDRAIRLSAVRTPGRLNRLRRAGR